MRSSKPLHNKPSISVSPSHQRNKSTPSKFNQLLSPSLMEMQSQTSITGCLTDRPKGSPITKDSPSKLKPNDVFSRLDRNSLKNDQLKRLREGLNGYENKLSHPKIRKHTDEDILMANPKLKKIENENLDLEKHKDFLIWKLCEKVRAMRLENQELLNKMQELQDLTKKNAETEHKHSEKIQNDIESIMNESKIIKQNFEKFTKSQFAEQNDLKYEKTGLRGQKSEQFSEQLMTDRKKYYEKFDYEHLRRNNYENKEKLIQTKSLNWEPQDKEDFLRTWQSQKTVKNENDIDLLDKITRLEHEKTQLLYELELFKSKSFTERISPKQKIRRPEFSSVLQGKSLAFYENSTLETENFMNSDELLREVCNSLQAKNPYELLEASKKYQLNLLKMDKVQENLDQICALVFKGIDVKDINNFKTFDDLYNALQKLINDHENLTRIYISFKQRVYKGLLGSSENYGPTTAAEIIDCIDKLKIEVKNSVEIQKTFKDIKNCVVGSLSSEEHFLTYLNIMTADFCEFKDFLKVKNKLIII